MTTVTVSRCATPACRAKAGHGSRGTFCASCADRLAAVRDEYNAEAARRCASTLNGHKKHQVRTPTCSSPYCQNARVAPAPYCDDCTEAGYVAEDAA